MSAEANGRKEVIEAVLIAGLSSLATALVSWGVESAKAKAAERKAVAAPAKVSQDAKPD
jgi:hypothetical protein